MGVSGRERDEQIRARAQYALLPDHRGRSNEETAALAKDALALLERVAATETALRDEIRRRVQHSHPYASRGEGHVEELFRAALAEGSAAQEETNAWSDAIHPKGDEGVGYPDPD